VQETLFIHKIYKYTPQREKLFPLVKLKKKRKKRKEESGGFSPE
jgi:accessory gene regulator protein AgrB